MKNDTRKKPFYKNLGLYVIIAMLAGIILGIVDAKLAILVKPGIDYFIETIKIIVAPIVFLTVITGIVGMGNLKRLGKIGAITVLYFEVISTLALIIGMLFGHLFHPGRGMNMNMAQMDPNIVAKYAKEGSQAKGFLEILRGAIPSDPISPFIHSNTLQVLFMAVCCGLLISLFAGKHQNKIMNSFNFVGSYLFKLLNLIMLFSPVAAFSAMAFMIGKFGTAIIWNMAGLIGVMLISCLFFLLVVLGIVAKLSGFNILHFLRLIRHEILLVMATSSSESALGPIMQRLSNAGVSKTVVGVVIPSGYSFNLDGTNIYLSLAIVFLCQAFNIPLSWEEQLSIIAVLMLTSKGAAGVSGSGFIILASTLAAMGGKIPVVTLGLLLGIDKVLADLRSMTNLIGNSVAAVVIAKFEKELDGEAFAKALK